MADQISIDRFLEAVRASGLLPEGAEQKLLSDLNAAGENPANGEALAKALVRNGTLTEWQTEMLMKGKHRGFHLGPYVLLRPLGQGAMGHVFLAEHTMMRRNCAIKLLAKKYREDPDLLARFQVEARAIAALDHPHIVRAYDFNRDTSTGSELYYLVMEYVEGQDLQRMVEKNGVLDYRRAAEFIRQAAVGLAHAHEAGFIHRDIKPGNLLVDTKGTLKILDLGLARLVRGGEDVAQNGTWVSGTPDYIAPEQILNRPDLDGRADIYSLGLTFYFLLVGRRPYIKKTMPEILAAHCREPLEPIDVARSDIPYDLISIIEKMTAKLPDRRYRTASELAAALQTWLENDAAGQSSRLATFKNAAMRSRHRATVDGDGGKSPPGEGVDLELAPLEESPGQFNAPAPPTVSMQVPSEGTHRSTDGKKVETSAESLEARSISAGDRGVQLASAPVELPPSLGGEVSASATAAAELLEGLPFSADVATPLTPLRPVPAKKRPRDWKQRVVEIVRQSPWLWAAIGGVVFVAIVTLFALLVTLLLPGHGIERSEPNHSNGVACVREQRTNVQHFETSPMRSVPT